MRTFRPYTFGSMSLGRDLDRLKADIALARRAMEAGVWFHSSPTYNRGFTYMVLRMAFEAAPSERPPVILKIRDGSPELMRFETEDACRRLGIEAVDVAQLVSMTPDLVNQLNAGGGPLVDELASLRERGLIRSTALYLYRGNSDAGVRAADHELIDQLILYWNACQRDCTAEAWEAILRQELPVLALRTLGGGPADASLSGIRSRLPGVMEAAGCLSETELNLRLAYSYPQVLTTIGGTADAGHLEAFLDAAADPVPLPEDVLVEIDVLTANPTK